MPRDRAEREYQGECSPALAGCVESGRDQKASTSPIRAVLAFWSRPLSTHPARAGEHSP